MGPPSAHMMCVMPSATSSPRSRICKNGAGERHGKIADAIEESLNEDDDPSYQPSEEER